MKKTRRLPLWHSVFWIVGSCLVTSAAGHKWIPHLVGVNKKNPKDRAIVTHLIATGPQKSALHFDYLQELLGLCKEIPTYLDTLDLQETKKKLLQSPLIASASLQKRPPSALYIDYTIRTPVAFALDFVNTAMDEKRHLFPFSPFFSPKNLPEIYLGSELVKNSLEGFQLKGEPVDLAFAILEWVKSFEDGSFRIQRVDVSSAYNPSLGQRDLVVRLENTPLGTLHTLRLSSSGYRKEITNYFKLRNTQLQLSGDKVIDLRLAQLAYIE